ncbi:MAG: histidine kinase [Kordia sp.]|nr:MAG: histidine kinase [Kordia sp.]
MIKLNFLIFFISLLLSVKIYPQQKVTDNLFQAEILKKTQEFKKETQFKKAHLFYLEQEWDSTLVYTMKQISTTNYKELIDYCHFFRGHSFIGKKLSNKALNEFKSISPTFKFYHKVNINLGDILLKQGEFSKALKHYQEVESLIIDNKPVFKKSHVIHNLGMCYTNLKQYNKAERYLLKSERLLERERDTVSLIGNTMDLAILSYGMSKKKHAEAYFKKAYDLSKKIKDFDTKRRTALNMSIVEEYNKNFSEALKYRKEVGKWKDSLNDQNKVWEVAELEKKFAVKQKQKEVTVLEAENKLKAAEINKLLYSAISLLVLLAAGGYFYREKIKTNKIIIAQKATLDELNATKDKLFSIVSHDLRSSVNALKTSNTKLQESLETKNFTELDTQLNTNSAITNGAYNLLDNLLNWALLQTQQGYFEITSMRLFFIVEHVAYNYKPLLLDKNISFENTIVKKEFIDADQESLKIILRNLLDNAIKFSTENGSIKVYSRNTNDNYCELVIEDTGLGMSENTRLELLKDTALLSKKENEDIIGTGLGVQLVKQMIQKNKGKFNIESELGKGTKMIVSLPKTAG